MCYIICNNNNNNIYIMTLTNQEFSTYYNTLDFIIDSAGVVINDEVSDVATYNIVQGKLNIENAIIDGFEYELTDKQKDIIYLAILGTS